MFPLRIYTALKPVRPLSYKLFSLFPLRIYTALKHKKSRILVYIRLFLRFPHCSQTASIAIYCCIVCFPYEFTLLSNCIDCISTRINVCFPYEFTLLSNISSYHYPTRTVCFPYEFTLLSNLKPQIAREKYLRNICVTSLVFFGNTFILT